MTVFPPLPPEEEEEQERRRVEELRNFWVTHTRLHEGGAASSRRRKKRKKNKVPKTRRRPLPQLVACRSARVGMRIRRRGHGFCSRSSRFWCSFVVLAVSCSVSCCSPEKYSHADSGKLLPEWFPYSSPWFDSGYTFLPVYLLRALVSGSYLFDGGLA